MPERETLNVCGGVEESCAREQIAERRQIGKGSDSQLCLPSGKQFGFIERDAQLLKGTFAEHYGKEDSFWAQGAPTL